MRDTVYLHSLRFSEPLGNVTTFKVDLMSMPGDLANLCYYETRANWVCIDSLDTPPASMSSITTDYVVFYIVDNASSAPILASFTGPDGPLNVTGYSPPQSITLDPDLGHESVNTFQYFQTNKPGNYSAHILATKCNYVCSTTNATGYIMTGQSRLVYNRPYYVGGLATVVVGGIGIALTLVFLAVNTLQVLTHRKKHTQQNNGEAVGRTFQS